MSKGTKVITSVVIIVLLLLIAGVVSLRMYGNNKYRSTAKEEIKKVVITPEQEIESKKEITESKNITVKPQKVEENTKNDEISQWYLILVNNKYAIPDDYTVETVEIENGLSVDKRIKDDLQQMLDDCRAANLEPQVISAYRTRDLQQWLYDHTDNKNDTALPGHSEHECGLAVDVLESGYDDDWDDAEKTAQTETQQWLTAHCQDYGFILRYPKGKEDITGIVYESWHYRYVGKKHAKAIMKDGLCLEEYIEKLKKQ